MYVPAARNSFAKACSTRVTLPVFFFALSFGTKVPQLLQDTESECPLLPLARPPLLRFLVN